MIYPTYSPCPETHIDLEQAKIETLIAACRFRIRMQMNEFEAMGDLITNGHDPGLVRFAMVAAKILGDE